MARSIRLTQRRAMLIKARAAAQVKVENKIRPVFKRQFKVLERFLRKGNLRKKMNKSNDFLKFTPEDEKQKEQWDAWKKTLLLALLLGLFSAADDLAAVENEIWTSRGLENLTYDAETLIQEYQFRTGRPLTDIGDATIIAVQTMIANWYASDKPFPDLIHDLDKYFNDIRVHQIAVNETSNLLSQMVKHQMESYNFSQWYWDAMGENPCSQELTIDGVTWDGCISLNGHLFPRGALMPPDAAHIGCQCLPTPRVIDRTLGKGDIEGHEFYGNQWVDGGHSLTEYKDINSLPPVQEGMVRIYHGTMRQNLAPISFGGLRPASQIQSGGQSVINASISPFTGYGDSMLIADLPKEDVHSVNNKWIEVHRTIKPFEMIGVIYD